MVFVAQTSDQRGASHYRNSAYIHRTAGRPEIFSPAGDILVCLRICNPVHRPRDRRKRSGRGEVVQEAVREKELADKGGTAEIDRPEIVDRPVDERIGKRVHRVGELINKDVSGHRQRDGEPDIDPFPPPAQEPDEHDQFPRMERHEKLVGIVPVFPSPEVGHVELPSECDKTVEQVIRVHDDRNAEQEKHQAP